MTTSSSQLDLSALLNALEPLIRRVVREEIAEAIKNTPGLFYLQPETPLYQDMQDILQRKATGELKLYGHAEL
jgi:hypothetical protein